MIKLTNIHKTYHGEPILEGLSLELPNNLTLSILGKSGSGKSTLLKIMAGIEKADQGQFTVNDHDIFSLPPQKRGVVYLSQEPLLFPHLSIYDNLSYGLKIRKLDRNIISNSVHVLAEKIGLQKHLEKKPHQISGGQKQRVNFGRALIINPDILLLDEPFGSLDPYTREEMQTLYNSIRQELHITSIFVTHDIKEALLMGDNISILQAGKLEVFPSKTSFIHHPTSGAWKEINFWKQFISIS